MIPKRLVLLAGSSLVGALLFNVGFAATYRTAPLRVYVKIRENGQDRPPGERITVIARSAVIPPRRWRTDENGLLQEASLIAGTWFIQPIKEGYRTEHSTDYTVSVSPDVNNPPDVKDPMVIVPNRAEHSDMRRPLIFVLVSYTAPQHSEDACPEAPSAVVGRVVSISNGQSSGLSNVHAALLRVESPSDTLKTEWQATAAPDGCFAVPARNVPPNAELYLQLERTGSRVTTVALNTSQTRIGDIELPPLGEPVRDRAMMTGMDEATHRYVFEIPVFQNLPLPRFRSVDDLALLAPGILPPPETYGRVGPGLTPGVGTAGQFSANGLRSRENNFTTDGSDNNDENVGVRRQGFVAQMPQPLDSLMELQVLTALPDARFGRNIGAQVNALTASGGRAVHGRLYGFGTDHRVNARDFFETDHAVGFKTPQLVLDGSDYTSPPPPTGRNAFTRTQAGLSVGGPIAQAFWLASYERDLLRSSELSHFNVPTPGERVIQNRGSTTNQGNRGFLVGSTQIYPTSVAGDAIFSLFPFPNNPQGPYGVNTFTTSLPADQNAALLTGKIDVPMHLLRRSHFFTVRYDQSRDNSELPSIGGALFSSVRPVFATENIASHFLTDVTPHVANAFRVSYGATRGRFDPMPQPFLVPSTQFKSDPYLLNAPLLMNVTTPATAPESGRMLYVSAESQQLQALISGPLSGYELPRGTRTSDVITGPLGQVNIAGFSSVGVDPSHFPQQQHDATWQWADTTTFQTQKHTLNAGIDIRSVRLNSTVEQNLRPRADYVGLYRIPDFSNGAFITQPVVFPQNAFNSVTMAAAGYPAGLFQTITNTTGYRLVLHKTQVDSFVQDEFHITPSLVVTAGIRFGAGKLPADASNHFVNAFNVTQLNAAVDSTRALTACRSFCQNVLANLQAAFPQSFKNTFGANSLGKDLRLGIAWSPTSSKTFVVRAGWGSYTGQFPAIIVNEARGDFPDFVPLNWASPRGTEQLVGFLFNPANPILEMPGSNLDLGILQPGTLNTIRPPGVSSISAENSVQLLALNPSIRLALLPGLVVTQPAPQLRNPNAYHYSVTVEKSFGEKSLASLSYVGTAARHLLRVSTPDQGFLRSEFSYEGFGRIAVSFPLLRGSLLSPQQGNVRPLFPISRLLFEGSASSSYNSLQAQWRQRYAYGITTSVAFTYSHAIDEASDFFDDAGAFALPQNSVHRSERASSNYDLRFRFTSYILWDLPARRRIGTWQFSAVVSAQTGQPFTVNTAFDTNEDGNATDRLNRTDGLIVGSALQDRHFSIALRPGTDPIALIAPAGQDGAVGRNTFRASAQQQIDAAIMRVFAVRSVRVLARGEIFNLLNRAQFGIPQRILEAASFGAAVRTIAPARIIQAGLKLEF